MSSESSAYHQRLHSMEVACANEYPARRWLPSKHMSV
jgi:hypothetical protein